MRFKLYYKLFALNLSIVLALTLVFLALSYHSHRTIISDAMNGVDREVMKVLAIELADIYTRDGSWKPLTTERDRWSRIVNENFFKVFFAVAAPPKPTNPTYDPEKACELSFGTFFQRLTLLDHNKKPIIYSEIPSEGVHYQKIVADGETIGWLEVGKISMDIVPLAEQVFDLQLKVIFLASVISGVLAILLSLVLSRRITRPIEHLADGAANIAQRKFNQHITINSNDELNDLAQSFNTISRELSRFQDQQKQWLMDIAHELRTPLTVLIGEAMAICEKVTPCDIKAVESLKEEALQIQRLVEDLHELSTFSTTEFSLNTSVFDMNELILQVTNRYQPILGSHQFDLKCVIPKNATMIDADSDRLTQVLQNIFENAIHYCDRPGTIQIRLSCSNTEVIVDIEDSGPGVSEEALPKIFNRLFREDSSRRRAHKGSGLGLAICKEIIFAHNGLIHVENGVTGGLLFTIHLPLRKE